MAKDAVMLNLWSLFMRFLLQCNEVFEAVTVTQPKTVQAQTIDEIFVATVLKHIRTGK